MEVATVSLSSWEHEILGRIAKELTGTDPKLTSLVKGFNRIVAAEEMPSRPGLTSVRRSRKPGGYRRKRRHHTARSSWFLMTLWFVTTAALIAVALVLNLFGPGGGVNRSCVQARTTSCTGGGSGALSVLAPRLGS
jgi:hypothetical protein